MNVRVVVFPGTNCDHDIIHAYDRILNESIETVWHRDKDLRDPDLVILPGGFSYGDYLRPGALSRISPIMDEVKRFADSGGPVLGICNGFQILCETELLPGALLQNVGRKFLSRFVTIQIERVDTPFTSAFEKGEVITCPIAHFDGNYFADSKTLAELEGEGRVVFRYADENDSEVWTGRESNPNGSCASIAGISNAAGNVVGMMPHPERAIESIVGHLGGSSGLKVFQSALG